MDRERLAAIFRDTRDRYETDIRLRSAVCRSGFDARIYQPSDPIKLPEPKAQQAKLSVVNARTFACAKSILDSNPTLRVAVLNFASATNPGGGVLGGSSAQEECLCRCSTLYPTLDQQRFWNEYYHYHRVRGDIRYNDACIYSPDVVVFKSDELYPELLPEDEWYTVDVITCAAPNLMRPSFYDPENGVPHTVSAEELYDIHVSRTRRICEVAAANGVDALVLGAFGCGAFLNDPWVVASAFKRVLPEVSGYFDVLAFAIYSRPGGGAVNLKAFSQTLLGE